jgi:cytochrome c2
MKEIDTSLFYQLGVSARLSAQRAELSDEQALKMKDLQQPWRADEDVKAGDRKKHGDKLYKCRQDHTTQAGWEPDVTPAMREVIDETHAGTKEDPIPYSQGMALELDKYYTQAGVLYLCIRASGQPLYNNLSELVGNYVNIAA